MTGSMIICDILNLMSYDTLIQRHIENIVQYNERGFDISLRNIEPWVQNIMSTKY